MLSLKRLTGWFGRERGLKKVAPRKQQARLSLEMLETRDGPAALNFVSPAAIWGGAALDGKASTAVRSLRSSSSGNMAQRIGTGYPQSQAYASLNYSTLPNNKTLYATTSAFTTGSNTSTAALMHTTNDGSNYQYVTVRIDPTAYGEQNGQRVQVTLQASFLSSIGQFNRANAVNSFSFYVNGQPYLNGQDTTRDVNGSPERFSTPTLRFTTTIGATFQIAFHVYSQAGANGSGVQNHNVATNQFVLNMGVQRV